MYMYKKLNLLCLMILAGNCGDLFSMDKELDREPPARGSKWLAIRSDHEELWDGLISLDLAAIEKFANKTTVDVYKRQPKGYQITQQYQPICLNGYVPIRLEDGSIKKITLRRIHIEEDAGKNLSLIHI